MSWLDKVVTLQADIGLENFTQMLSWFKEHGTENLWITLNVLGQQSSDCDFRVRITMDPKMAMLHEENLQFILQLFGFVKPEMETYYQCTNCDRESAIKSTLCNICEKSDTLVELYRPKRT